MREMLDRILDAYYGRFLDAVADGRGKTREAVAALVDAAPMTAAEALDAGLVDSTYYEDEFDALVRLAADEVVTDYVHRDGPRLADLSNPFAVFNFLARARPPRLFGPKIAVVYATGTIIEGARGGGVFGEQVMSARAVTKLLAELSSDEKIRAVVLRVDSPGGSALASEVIWRAIRVFRERTGCPVVASLGNTAASGGYYIACAADRIVAEPGTITGSIGVAVAKLDLAGLYAKLGVHRVLLTRGAHADLFGEVGGFSEEERALVRRLAERTYAQFRARVAEGRGMEMEEVSRHAEGQLWTGAEARKRGLVDQLGGLAEAIELAKTLGVGPDETPFVVVYPRTRSFLEYISEAWGVAAPAMPAVTAPAIGVPGIERLKALVAPVRLIADEHVLTYWPCVVEIR